MQGHSKSLKILGISAYYHDSAAAICVNGIIVAAAQEERFTRKKHDAEFPFMAVKFCLEKSGLTLNDLDAVVFYDKPFLKFERLLESYLAFAPKGLISFITAMPVWLSKKLFLKQEIKKALYKIQEFDRKKLNLLFTEHHLAHAAGSFFSSPFSESAILTVDGVGEWCTAAMAYGKNNQITFSHEMNFPHSVGLLYASFTYFLGFKVNSGEYKVMGLAPYGNKHSQAVENFMHTIKSELVQINRDGSIFLNQKYFTYATSLTMVKDKKWKLLFGIQRRAENEPIEQVHCDLALAIQSITEEVMIKMAMTCKSLSESENLCLSGGLALNCVANKALREANIFKNIYVQPASGDAGGAIGAALAAYYIYAGQNRRIDSKPNKFETVYLGPVYKNKDIEQFIGNFNAKADFIADELALCKLVGKLLADEKIIGWFQGSMEFGPRALGNRSILANVTNTDMQKKLNLKIKNREDFRPFAPAILAEYADQYFERTEFSEHMMFVTNLRQKYCIEIPVDFEKWSMQEKLNYKKSDFPAITHVDLSARIQCVEKVLNPRFWLLIEQYRQIIGVPMLVNTSFNVRGEPIVCSPEEAYACFMESGIDVLVMENYVFYKEKQMDHDHPTKWKRHFEKD